jgi:hypothetical protein
MRSSKFKRRASRCCALAGLGAGLVLLVVLLMPTAAGARDASPRSPLPPLATVPVVSCPVEVGAGSPPTVGIPRLLTASLPAKTASRLSAFSNGIFTVLGPKGWACSSLFAADGSQNLGVFPPGESDPTAFDASNTLRAVIARVDYLGHGPGVSLVCDLFPNAPGVKSLGDPKQFGSSCSPPANEVVQRPTPDVALFRDRPSVKGTGDLSGGPNQVSGVLVFPQNDPASVGNIAKESCALPRNLASLCGAILSDFAVREFPREEAQQ